MRHKATKFGAAALAWILATMMWSGAAFSQYSDEEAPAAIRGAGQAIIESQMQAFRSRDHTKAYSFAAPSLRKLFGDTDLFIGMVRSGYGAIYDARGWSFGRSRMNGGTLYQELLITGPNNREWIALYTMIKDENGAWRIAGVRMIPGTGQST